MQKRRKDVFIMKKTMKKATVLFAACALSMAALAGCGDKKDASSSSQATQQSAAPSVQSAAPETGTTSGTSQAPEGSQAPEADTTSGTSQASEAPAE